MSLITPEQLKAIATTLSPERCKEMADLLNELCPKYGIVTTDVFHEFLANVLHESGEFNLKDENMNYSASRLRAVWPSRFPSFTAANQYARNPKKLANFVYGGRMGNKPGTDDGWTFRGSGFVGLTGREMYTKYAKYINKPVEEAANLIRTTDRYALDSALWFFCVLKNLEPLAENDEFTKIVKHINGGLIGLADRQKYYERAKKIIP